MKQTEEIELIEVLQPELLAIIETSTIVRTKAEEHAAAFAPFMKRYIILSDELKAVNKENPSLEDAEKARDIRLKMVKVRTGSGDVKDVRKEIIKAEDGLIMGLYNVVKNSCVLTESEALEIEKHRERIEAERKAELSASRIELLLPFEVNTTYLPLAEMTEEQFQIILSSEKEKFEAVKESRRLAEIKRVADEKESEDNRLAEIAKQEAERERIRLENIELKKQADAKELELQAERKKAEAERLKLQAENEKIQAEDARLAKLQADKIAEIEAKNAQIAKELKAKQNAIDLAHEQEKRRIEDEENDRKAKEKAALLAPDKEKVRVLFDTIKSIQIPEFKSTEAIELGIRVKEALEIVKKLIIEDSKKLV